jgi:succinate-semialdehyde dehydrogenase/glutarate-semialdehyde dehydrogenase
MDFYLNGRPYGVAPEGVKLVDILNPVTEEVLDRLPLATSPEDAERVLDLAEEGLRLWSAKPMWERAEAIFRFAALLEAEADRVSDLMCRNMGRAITECRGEVAVTITLARGFAERAKHLYGDVMPQSQPGLEDDLIFTRREPLGTFLCIVPFNAPVELYVHKVIPALLMGNAVVVKPPTPDPLTELLLTDMLVRAGVPKQAIQMIFASGAYTSAHFIKSPRLAAVTFTGSTETGKKVYREAAGAMHRVFLEMGGNDPFVVLDDADLDNAAEQLVTTRMMNSGQVCCSSKRTLVPEAIADELIERIRARLALVNQGDPLDPKTEVGSLVAPKAAQLVQQQVDRAISLGARCLIGGHVRDGVFFEPTLLVDVTRDMDVAKDSEIFGPVISVIRYSTLDEAVEIANQTSYGLQASIITGDLTRAFALAARLQAGMIVLNGAGSYRHVDMPFGGYKHSGIGREGIAATLEEFSQEKCYVLKNVFAQPSA